VLVISSSLPQALPALDGFSAGFRLLRFWEQIDRAQIDASSYELRVDGVPLGKREPVLLLDWPTHADYSAASADLGFIQSERVALLQAVIMRHRRYVLNARLLSFCWDERYSGETFRHAAAAALGLVVSDQGHCSDWLVLSRSGSGLGTLEGKWGMRTEIADRQVYMLLRRLDLDVLIVGLAEASGEWCVASTYLMPQQGMPASVWNAYVQLCAREW